MEAAGRAAKRLSSIQGAKEMGAGARLSTVGEGEGMRLLCVFKCYYQLDKLVP